MSIDTRHFHPYLSRHDIEAVIVELAGRINRDYEGKDVVLVTVLKGPILFISDLVRALKIDAQVEFVRLSNYGKSKSAIPKKSATPSDDEGTVVLVKDIQTNIRGKHVLIVEEIIDSGRALNFLYERLKMAKPASIEVVTLLDKESKRLSSVPVKYVGRKVTDQFFVGYGLDLEERARNLPDIYYLKYPN